MEMLRNYRNLVAKVDELCRRIAGEFGEHLACRAGCDGCCRHISLFRVEGIALAAAVNELPGEKAGLIRERARAASSEGPCPLLEDGLCILYAARPIICRTHGFPILTTQGNEQLVDFCPMNFRNMSSLPGNAVIDLDRLNTALISVDALFIADFPNNRILRHDRLTVAEALLLGVCRT
ncbi:MAG: hypothetical protein FD174_2619 [Geobacteraceae bacterium]|nr:MAG: hypothetical protein FD174_2619 [Geobacteraceae bacterium]